jgi:L-cysteine desulfidase
MQVRINVGAAGDARMGGANTPIMTTSGSGNLGIMATIPIAIIGEMKNIDRDVICKATLLSHFITKLAGISCGSLSALCGCAIKAGIGATAAITYLLNGSIEQIHAAINLMAANNTGFICDGAKEGCALKLSTAAGTAIECALLALNGIRVPSDNGIIFDNAENTIKAIGQVSNCMTPADIEIIKVMNSKIT